MDISNNKFNEKNEKFKNIKKRRKIRHKTKKKDNSRFIQITRNKQRYYIYEKKSFRRNERRAFFFAITKKDRS